jgi:HSP20 family molecular chaperone IbpA
MKKKLLILFTSLSVFSFLTVQPDCEVEPELSFVMSIDYDLDVLLDQLKSLQEYTDEVLDEGSNATDSIQNGVGRYNIALSEDDDSIVVALNVPNLDVAAVDIEVEGKKLKGIVPLPGQDLKLEIADGMLLISSSLSAKEETEGESMSVYQSVSTQMMSLPARIGNLDSTSIEYKDSVLSIRVPKFQEPKPESKKLKVSVK